MWHPLVTPIQYRQAAFPGVTSVGVESSSVTRKIMGWEGNRVSLFITTTCLHDIMDIFDEMHERQTTIKTHASHLTPFADQNLVSPKTNTKFWLSLVGFSRAHFKTYPNVCVCILYKLCLKIRSSHWENWGLLGVCFNNHPGIVLKRMPKWRHKRFMSRMVVIQCEQRAITTQKTPQIKPPEVSPPKNAGVFFWKGRWGVCACNKTIISNNSVTWKTQKLGCARTLQQNTINLRAGFRQNGFFRGFFFLSRRIFSRIFSPDFFSSFLWEKIPRKSSRKIPGKILQNLYDKNPPTHFCRLKLHSPKFVPKLSQTCLGVVPQMSWRCPRDVPEMSRPCPGNVPNIPQV